MDSELSGLNSQFELLHPVDRVKELFKHYKEDEVLVTSSFGSTSVILLHLLSKAKPGFPVHFIDTGYHFEETLQYKNEISKIFDLKFLDVKAQESHHRFTKDNQTWKSNQDLCCYINKVRPIEDIKANYKVWISGLMAFQNVNRQNKKIFERKDHLLKFHPILDMGKEEVDFYMKMYDLPVHPLVLQGYGSIGCHHCTMKGDGRSGRWFNTSKTECGLHA